MELKIRNYDDEPLKFNAKYLAHIYIVGCAIFILAVYVGIWIFGFDTPHRDFVPSYTTKNIYGRLIIISCIVLLIVGIVLEGIDKIVWSCSFKNSAIELKTNSYSGNLEIIEDFIFKISDIERIYRTSNGSKYILTYFEKFVLSIIILLFLSLMTIMLDYKIPLFIVISIFLIAKTPGIIYRALRFSKFIMFPYIVIQTKEKCLKIMILTDDEYSELKSYFMQVLGVNLDSVNRVIFEKNFKPYRNSKR